jgi:hypothetical protein
MCNDPSICVIAKRGSGKSWIVKNILHKLNTYEKFQENTLIICATERLSPFYKYCFPKAKIIYSYETEALQNYLLEQTMRISEADKRYKKSGMRFPCNGCVVLDDCLSSSMKWKNDQSLLELLYNGRHYQTTVIFTMQFSLGIPPEFRCNFDYVFLLAEAFFSNQKRLYDHYGGMFPTFDDFRKTFLRLTTDYSSMVIINKDTNASLLDRIKYFKAENTNFDE